MLRDFFSDLRYRVTRVFGRDAAERDMAEEMEFHLDREVERLLRDGATLAEARRRARIAFGGVEQVKEAARDSWGVRMVEELSRDIAHSLRLARRQPGFSAVVVLSLALGLGATMSVCNLAWNVLFAPIAVPHPEQLAEVVRVNREGPDDSFSWGEFTALKATPGVGALAAMRNASAITMSAGDQREYINLQFVDGAWFSVAGVAPVHGRLISAADDASGAPVVVLSETLAEHLFPGDTDVIGHRVAMRGTSFTVIGVTPRSFKGVYYPGWFVAAIPMGAVQLLGASGPGRDSRGVEYGRRDERATRERAFQVIGRLTTGLDAARSALAPSLARAAAPARAGEREWLDVRSIRSGISVGKNDMRGPLRGTLVILIAGMALVLVVVCCNIASLLLVRTTARQREIAVRLSLGASRARLAAQLTMENLPLALAGGVGGLAFGAWAAAGFVRTLPSDWDTIAGMFAFQFSPVIVVTSIVLSLACGLAFALYPALRATREDLAQTLRLDARSSRSRRQGSVARGVVVVQVAVTVVLVSAASLLALTLVKVSHEGGGFASERVVLATIEARSTPYENTEINPVRQEIMRRVRDVPGVRAVGMASQVPLYGGSISSSSIEAPGYVPPDGKEPFVSLIAATPGYFSMLEVRLVSGREFDDSDDGPGATAGLVNEAFVQAYLRGREPLGQTIRVAVGRNRKVPVQIVGVVSDVRYHDLRSAPGPLIYVPMGGPVLGGGGPGQLVVRSAGTPAAITQAVVKAVLAAAPGITVRRVRDMTTQRQDAMVIERLSASLATFVSAMALVLSAVGLYGVVAYSVARRTSEIGVRLALGARTGAVLWLVARETLTLVGVGVSIGAVLSYGANGAMAGLIYGIGPHDPFAVIGAVAMLATVGFVASITPARRAMRVDPRIALNAD